MDAALSELLAAGQYAVPLGTKEPAMVAGLRRLTQRHRDRCPPYARILDAWQSPGTDDGVADQDGVAAVPYLPAPLFKSLDLRSIPVEAVFKVMTSSGTSGQVPSRIYLDVETARLQSRALSSIMGHYLGSARRPMLIIDHPDVLRDRRRFSARAAGILGMMTFGRDHLFALDEEMRVARSEILAWLERHAGQDLLLFGFTSMVWQDFLEPLRGEGLDLSRGTLFHSGGWKRLVERSVAASTFKAALREAFGLTRVHDFYGMVEQVGSVYVECEAGFFHAPNFGDVIVRDPISWKPAPIGREGVVEVVSLLPQSYPGHAILTQDLGTVHGVDDCPCGRLGRRFTIAGRVPRAEIRGCSDTLVRA